MLCELMRRVRFAAIAFLFAIAGSAIAQISLIDVQANPKDWKKAVAGARVLGSWDFSTLPDFGVTSIAGPLTSAGAGPIPPGFIPSIVQIDSSRFFPSQPITLALIGPSAVGRDNLKNAVVPNQPQDSFDVFFATAVGAFQFEVTVCGPCAGSLGVINISVLDDLGAATVFANVAAPDAGHVYGLVGKKGRRISAVNLSYSGAEIGSPDQNHYNPGIQGVAIVYAPTKLHR